jgi:hypothetical protein
MKIFSGTALAVIAALAAAPAAKASTFNINVVFGGGLSTTQQSIFTTAATYWESVITGYQEDPGILGLTINAVGAVIDGVGGTLGSAGPTGGVLTTNYLYASQGNMTFDSADLGNLETNGTLLDVILHEMAHVIGFGTLWSSSAIGLQGYQEVYASGSGQFTGAYALAEYQTDYSQPGATFVPVELGGGSGTANGHWDELDGGAGDGAFAGGKNELMTGWLNTPSFVSDTTIASFADIGYTTSVTHPAGVVPLPAGGILFFSALAALGLARRRCKT